MTDDILDNRPKPQTDTAVEEWLKHNKPTVLADFERIKPKSKHRIHKSDPLLMRRVKRAIKEQYGLILADVTKTIATTKQVRVMELSR